MKFAPIDDPTIAQLFRDEVVQRRLSEIGVPLGVAGCWTRVFVAPFPSRIKICSDSVDWPPGFTEGGSSCDWAGSGFGWAVARNGVKVIKRNSARRDKLSPYEH